jgi:acyl-CoA dehydrogenase
MDVTLSQEQLAWQTKARAFADEVLRPASLARDRIADPRLTFDWDIVRKGSQLGLRTAVVPPAWGGHGIDTVTQALVMAELARGDSAVAKTFSQCWKWSHLIATFCSEDQKARFLKPFVADDTLLLGLGNTEPNSGSDHRLPPPDFPRAGSRLSAVRDGDDWILNGEKCFIANGSVARIFFINARTDPNVSQEQGTTLFILPVDTPGMRIGKVFNKSGWRFYQNAELIFEDARVPHANVVGEVNRGFNLRKSTSAPFGDLELAANALGVCLAAVELAVAHVRSREARARYFSANQHVQLKLSEMRMLTEALRSFVMRIAAEADDHSTPHDAANHILLHNFSTEVVQRVTTLNLAVHAGGGAAAVDARAEKLARDAVIWTHLAGDSVQRMKAVRNLVKQA